MRARWRLVLVWLCWTSAGQGAGPPSCPQGTAQRCASGSSGIDEYLYTVDGVRVTIEYSDGGYFLLKCLGNLTLDNPALPRFEAQLRVDRVFLTGCPPPAGSYADALAALNVLVLDKLALSGPAHIGRAQLAGLERLPALMLTGAELEPDALAALPALRRLHLDSLRLSPAALAALPPALTTLELVRTGATLSAALLARLPRLAEVLLRDSERAAVEPVGALQKIALEAPASHVPRRLLPSLRMLVLTGWDERAPEPWQDCGALESLLTNNARAEALPGDWLRACPRLRVLVLQDARALARVAEHALRGAAGLQELRVTGSRLAALPAGLLDDAPALRSLDLSGNLLHVLPSGLFARNKALISLNLSSNNFSKEVFASLQTVTSLKTLKLNNNIHLNDSCGGVSDTVRGTSKLQELKNLTELFLRNTSAEVICRDWRDNLLQLKKLDLSRNKITIITYSDLQFRSAALVNLSGSNVTRLRYTELDYERVLRGESLARADIRADFALTCDCFAYWAAAALRALPEHVRLSGVRCAGGGELVDAALTCPAPDLCAPGCTCGARPHAAPPPPPAAPPRALAAPPPPPAAHPRALAAPPPPPAAPPRALAAPPPPPAAHPRALAAPPPRALHVLCASLTRLPRLPAAAASYAQVLQLANNNITHVSVDDLPPYLLELDLRANQISRLDEEVARAMVSRTQVLRLGGNPLACDCRAWPALGVLRGSRALRDADRVPCLARAAPACEPAPRAALLAAAALLALLAAGALLALLAHPALRLRLKLALLACGWRPGAAPDDGRRFDAFVSFSHGDERFVREQLVARLESGPAPYRLCVHYRDWTPGGWIPAQIAASVRASRRTLAVVSEHFLRSAWARAELREAHALALQEREPRLVVLLLDDPERLPLDDKLRRYLAHNTYVRWGDPWFWHKLRLALPRGRPGAGPAPEGAEPAPERVEPAPEGAGLEPAVALELVAGDVTTLPSADQESLNPLT